MVIFVLQTLMAVELRFLEPQDTLSRIASFIFVKLNVVSIFFYVGAFVTESLIVII